MKIVLPRKELWLILNRNILKLTVYRKKDWVFLVGSMEKNQFHKHYAIQISIPVEGALTLIDHKTKILLKTAVFIKPNTLHRIDSIGQNLHLFFNPHSRMGLFINSLIKEKPYYYNNRLISGLLEPTKRFIQGKIPIETLALSIEKNFEESPAFKTFEKQTDRRILKVLDYLYDHRYRWVQAEECAQLV